MSEKPVKNPRNEPGRYYVTEDCLACEACQDAAPNSFRYGDDGLTYVFKQPATPAEEEQCREALLSCPMEAIGNDGEAESDAVGV